MKKLLLVFAACLLVFGVASQAQAFFDTGDLVRAMYDSQTGVEVVTDLGAISTLQGVTGYTNQADGTSNTVALTTFGTTATWSAVKTAYFAMSSDYSIAYIAGTGAMTPAGANNSGNFLTGAATVLSTYAGSASTVTGTTGNTGSYYFAMNNAGGNIGSMGIYLDPVSAGKTEVTNSNSALLNTQLLYVFANLDSQNAGTPLANAAGNPIANFTILTASGATTINPSAVPIPPSILLMGSGLLGLIGIGRRKLFA